MALSSLPTELLHLIISYCSDRTDEAVNLTYLNRRFHSIANPFLYRLAAQEENPSALANAVRRGLVHLVQLCLDSGGDPNGRIWDSITMQAKYPELFGVTQGPRSDARQTLGASTFSGLLRHLTDPTTAAEPVEDERTKSENTSDEDTEGLGRRADDMYLTKHPFQSRRCHEDSEIETFWSPLHIAAARGDLQIMRMLFDHGANPRIPGSGVCLCHNSVMAGMFLGFEIDGELEAIRTIHAWSPLHVAVCAQQYDCAELLIEQDGGEHLLRLRSTDVTDSALYIEVYEWDEPDESPDAPDDVFLDPATLYHTAAMHDSDTVRLDRIFNLLKHPKLFPEDGLGVDVGDLYGNTALAVAAYAGHLRQLGPWFLERGANVNASVTVDVHSRTSISRTSMFLFLCNFGLFCEATLLMEMGAVVTGDWPDSEGMYTPHRNALHLCCHLNESPPGRPNDSPWRVERDANTLLHKLLPLGLELEQKDGNSRTPLLQAVEAKSPTILRTLMSAGADVHVKSRAGGSALHLLCEQNLDLASLACARLLVKAGVKIDQSDHNGQTPLHMLFARKYAPGDMYTSTSRLDRVTEENRACRDRLLGLLAVNGADLDVEIRRRTSLLVWAFDREGLSGIRTLLDLGAKLTARDYIMMLRTLGDQATYSKEPSCHETNSIHYLFHLLDTGSVGNEDLNDPTSLGSIDDAWSLVLLRFVMSRLYRWIGVLLEHGVRIPKPDHMGNNVVHMAATHWTVDPVGVPETSVQALKCLMAGGAKPLINRPNMSRKTPLHVAVEEGNVTMVCALVQNGADIHAAKGTSGSAVTRAIWKSFNHEDSTALLKPMLDLALWKAPHKFLYMHDLVAALTHGKMGTYIRNKMLRRDSWTYMHSEPKLDDVGVAEARRFVTQATVRVAMGLHGCGVSDQVDSNGDTALSRLLQFLLGQAAKTHVVDPEHDGFRIPDGREDAILALFRVLLSISTPNSLFSAENRLGQTVQDQIRELLICPLSDKANRQTMVIAALRTFVKVPLEEDSDLEDPWILGWAWRKSQEQGCPVLWPDLLVFNDMRAHHELVPRELLNDANNWQPFWRTPPVAGVPAAP